MATKKLPTPSEAELQEGHRNYLKWLRDNPNNFSYWFPKVQYLGESGIYIPRSVIQPIPEEVAFSFFMEKESDEERITAFVRETVLPLLQYDFPNRDVFLKNGCFSNKFQFDKACHLRFPYTEKDIVRHLLEIQYNSFAYETAGNLELVIREYINPEEGTPTIYAGMPLRPEMRLFYDFTSHRRLYEVNYWGWDYCHDGICYIFNQRKEDADTYESHYDTMTQQLEEYKMLHLGRILKALDKVQGLNGQWSVDFILEKERPILIDMAVAQQSAYWDPTRA